MTQNEAITKKRIMELQESIENISADIKSIEKCINIGKQLGLTEQDLLPWEYKENDMMCAKLNLEGELKDIRNECEHDFTMVGTCQTLFGDENIYQCKKCGYQTVNEQ